MASPSPDEGESFAAATGGGLGFDVGVFKAYLSALLPPGPCRLSAEMHTQSLTSSDVSNPPGD